MTASHCARGFVVAALAGVIAITPALGEPVEPSPLPETLTTRIVYLGKTYREPPPLSLVDTIATDKGVQGARIGLADNNATGRLIHQNYELVEVIAAEQDDVVEKAREVLDAGEALIVADLEAKDLLAVADLPSARNAVILDARTSDDELRAESCRANVFHIAPSWAMRADALAQYLHWKKWRRWFLISGKAPSDAKYVAAIRRSAAKFGAKIVEERAYTFDAGSRRTDSGHQQVQAQMPLLTQGAPEHDIVFVVDTGEAFGDYVSYRTSEPKPVVGTHGLVAVAWHRAFEQYAGMQMQNRFEKLVGRVMTERDYTAWLAVRVFGEAVTRTGKNDAASVRAYVLSKEFEVAGFKGQGMTFRPWDLQLRQPILLSGARALVSISPQEGFLHEKFRTDTLGFDEPETKCGLAR